MPIDFSTPQELRFPGELPAAIPLALLTALRDLDTPEDPDDLVVAHEALNLRRRLGLSRVVLQQIRRYEAERQDVTADEVANLFTLVARRSDAAVIFEAAGRRMGRENMSARGLGRRLATRILPLPLRRWRAWRRAGRCARVLCPGSPVRVGRRAGTLEVDGALPTRATEDGSGCSLLAGLIGEILEGYRANGDEIVHVRCEARGDDHCTWGLATDREAASQTEQPGAEPGAASGESDARD